MDVRPDQLIDVSLAAAEMLIAGLLGTLLYSLRGRRQQTINKQIITSAPLAVSTPSPAQTRSTTAGIEFMSFGSPSKDGTEPADKAPTTSEIRRRNRTDIIRQARQMLDRGAATHDITSTLRLTDGEVALLRQNINR